MKMKFATYNRTTNTMVDLFDTQYEAYNAMMEYIKDDRANNRLNPNGYYVNMLILDSNDNIVIRGNGR